MAKCFQRALSTLIPLYDVIIGRNACLEGINRQLAVLRLKVKAYTEENIGEGSKAWIRRLLFLLVSNPAE